MHFVYGGENHVAAPYTKGNVKSRRKKYGDLRLKMPRFFEYEKGEALGMFMGGVSHNAVAKHFNVHRAIV